MGGLHILQRRPNGLFSLYINPLSDPPPTPILTVMLYNAHMTFISRGRSKRFYYNETKNISVKIEEACIACKM
jgi:hypothetical protein